VSVQLQVGRTGNLFLSSFLPKTGKNTTYKKMEMKILDLLPCFATELEDALKKKGGKDALLPLQIPTTTGAPFLVCDLPPDAYAAVFSLCDAGKLSFCTVSSTLAKIFLKGKKLRLPLVTIESKPGQQYLLPMRLEAGIVPGPTGGRFATVGSTGTTFRLVLHGMACAAACWYAVPSSSSSSAAASPPFFNSKPTGGTPRRLLQRLP
jgi:hypothetical protein